MIYTDEGEAASKACKQCVKDGYECVVYVSGLKFLGGKAPKSCATYMPSNRRGCDATPKEQEDEEEKGDDEKGCNGCTA